MSEALSKIMDVLKDLNMISVAFRILLAMVCGGVIGLEREKANQSAGMRTYMLVCMGATVVMLTGQYLYDEFQTGDPARLGAQVISGIGFLGAGSIIISGNKHVKGLTTAAGLWVAGCIGLSIGSGFYEAAILVTIGVFFVMTKLRKLEEHIVAGESAIYVYVELDHDTGISCLTDYLKEHGIEVRDVRFPKGKDHCDKAVLGIECHGEYTQERAEEIIGEFQGALFIKVLS